MAVRCVHSDDCIFVGIDITILIRLLDSRLGRYKYRIYVKSMIPYISPHLSPLCWTVCINLVVSLSPPLSIDDVQNAINKMHHIY